MIKAPQGPQILETFSDLRCAVQFMNDFNRPWCLCGGWAIDLFVNRITRIHKDVDFAIWRHNQLTLRDYLTEQGWSVEKAIGGHLLPWPKGEFLELPIHTIWCKNPDAQLGFCEVLFNEANDREFLFRRNLKITLPLSIAIIRLPSYISILAPEIVLLYKANNLSHESNRSDFENALPYLNAERRAWLRRALQMMHPGHEWISRL